VSSSVRIAISEGVPVTGAGLHWVRSEAVLAASGPDQERLRQRWLRILRERRPSQAPGALEAMLDQPAVRTLLLVLDRRAEAVLLSESAAGWEAAWGLLQPAGTGVCTDLWVGNDGAGSFGWLDAIAGEPAAATAARLQAAAAMLAQALGYPAQPLVLHFASGPDARVVDWERQLATLRARLELRAAELYSPLLFAGGRLQAAAFLQAARQAAGAAAPALAPLLYVPRLSRAEFEAAFAGGGAWCGPFRAGAEAPGARVPAGAGGARLAATLALLAPLAAPAR
jgi:hypothetical protein